MIIKENSLIYFRFFFVLTKRMVLNIQLINYTPFSTKPFYYHLSINPVELKIIGYYISLKQYPLLIIYSTTILLLIVCEGLTLRNQSFHSSISLSSFCFFFFTANDTYKKIFGLTDTPQTVTSKEMDIDGRTKTYLTEHTS